MRKKILTVLLAVTIVAGFTACGSDDDDILKVSYDSTSVNETKDNLEDETIKTTGYTINVGGVDLFMGLDMKKVVDKISEKATTRVSGSCKYDGDEIEYKYNGVTVTALIEGDVEKVYSITLDNDLVKTKEGINIGASISAVVATYGEPEESGVYKYKKDDMVLMFLAENDEVASIIYTVE